MGPSVMASRPGLETAKQPQAFHTALNPGYRHSKHCFCPRVKKRFTPVI